MKEDIKYIYLKGGLGNILFQLVFYYRLKDHHHVKLIPVLTEPNIITKLLGWKIHDNSYRKLFINNLNNTIANHSIIRQIILLLFGRLSFHVKKPVFGIYFFQENWNPDFFNKK